MKFSSFLWAPFSSREAFDFHHLVFSARSFFEELDLVELVYSEPKLWPLLLSQSTLSKSLVASYQ